MELNDIQNRIMNFILENFANAVTNKVNVESSLLKDKIIDSLGVLTIITFLEQEFNITIADEDVNEKNFNSIKTISEFIKSKI